MMVNLTTTFLVLDIVRYHSPHQTLHRMIPSHLDRYVDFQQLEVLVVRLVKKLENDFVSLLVIASPPCMDVSQSDAEDIVPVDDVLMLH